jgi:hypothetical protein
MTLGRPLTRRRFLRALAGLGVLGFLTPSSLPMIRRFRGRANPQAATLLRLLSHPGAAAVVGREYLKVRPRESNAETLAALLHSALRLPGSRAGYGDAGDLRSVLRRRVREDFACGRTVEVRGWLLSETEARVCALACFS